MINLGTVDFLQLQLAREEIKKKIKKSLLNISIRIHFTLDTNQSDSKLRHRCL